MDKENVKELKAVQTRLVRYVEAKIKEINKWLKDEKKMIGWWEKTHQKHNSFTEMSETIRRAIVEYQYWKEIHEKCMDIKKVAGEVKRLETQIGSLLPTEKRGKIFNEEMRVRIVRVEYDYLKDAEELGEWIEATKLKGEN